MGKHQHYYESEKDLHDAFERGLDSGNLSTRFDDEWMTSENDLYEQWKYDTFRSSPDDLDWKSDYHDDDLNDDDEN